MAAQRKRVVAMAPYERPWSNVELVKDCGLIPYLLYRDHGCDVRMVGAQGCKYSYLELVRGLQMEFLPDGSVKTKASYIRQHAKEIHLLILRSCYETNFEVAYTYKEQNPQGKIYVGLDANSVWMDSIDWENPYFRKFMDCCDVIATSGKEVQRYLNQKWPWKIMYVPNGYYSFDEDEERRSFAEKENIILTVGRLGTQQKATHVMLEAFALAADQIPSWTLRLIGTVESDFQSYVSEYYQKHPDLRNRVIFAGSIQDRKELREEYQRAKIFTLSSEIEGGTPNVIAEALHAGCVPAVTRFDASTDATDHERCGRIADIDDANGLAHVYVELASDKKLEELSDRAYDYGRKHFDMTNIVDKLYELLFGGEG